MTTHTLTQGDLDGFADISGDDNPIHTDPDYAAGTAFELPVAHGMYLLSLVRTELARRWPNHRIASLELMFPTPSPVGSELRIEVDDTAGAQSGDSITVAARVRKADDTVGLDGSFVLVPRSAS